MDKKDNNGTSLLENIKKHKYRIALVSGVIMIALAVAILVITTKTTSNDDSINSAKATSAEVEANANNSEDKEANKAIPSNAVEVKNTDMAVTSNSVESTLSLASPIDGGKVIIPYMGDEGTIKKKNGAISMYGVYIEAKENTPVKACEKGTVEAITTTENGLTVTITHNDNTKTAYGNLSEVKVKANDEVQKGEEIGVTGTTSTFINSVNELSECPTSLYFETLQKNGDTFEKVNPTTLIESLN
ncbi:M23 family metallopeptidase [Clostridium bornimense]|uniref:M23 family metallopeptidase n=1 Tax=Clostridium bornimense TaxID=1216932 RepID=UPI001C0FAA30|nr:M23 family metallopeptidase [Clostridium bornimense]MBU5314929.1 M23 family metallopeptidase [Clostridium bornimense]